MSELTSEIARSIAEKRGHKPGAKGAGSGCAACEAHGGAVLHATHETKEPAAVATAHKNLVHHILTAHPPPHMAPPAEPDDGDEPPGPGEGY